MLAPHLKLKNLTVIIDKNNLQQTGKNQDILNLGNLYEKWKSFNWNTIEINGHSIDELISAFKKDHQNQMPKAIIANTVKGKGFSFSENNNDWHHTVLTKKNYDIALEELN